MNNLQFNEDQISFTLEVQQSAHLAEACSFAAEEMLDADRPMWRTLGMMFEACTITAFAQWQLDEAEQADWQEQLRLARASVAAETQGEGEEEEEPLEIPSSGLRIEYGQINLTLSLAQCADISDACLFAAESCSKNDKDIWRVLGTLFQTYVMASHISRKMDQIAINNEQILAAMQGTESALRIVITADQAAASAATAARAAEEKEEEA